MITKDEMHLILEREGINQFIHTRSYDPKTQIYETANGYYGMIFRIFPSPYLGSDTESKISAFMSLDFPKNTIIQFITYASRNISDAKATYHKLHTNEEGNPFRKPHVDNPDFLKVIAESNDEWLKKYSNDSIFAKEGLDLYLRDFINLATIMIPRVDEQGYERSLSDIESTFSQVKGAIAEFRPTNYDQREYVKFMREILNPSFPMWAPPLDRMTEISSQISDINSAVELDDSGKIIFGSMTQVVEKQGVDENGEAIIEEVEQRIQLKSQVETPKALTHKLKDWFSKKFGVDIRRDNKRVINADWYANVLTTKMFPEYVSMWDVSDLIMDYFKKRPQSLIPIPFLASLTISVGDRDKLVQKLEEDAKWNMFQLSNAAGAAKFMPELKDRAIEAKNIISLSTTQGEIPFKAMWSLTLFSQDEKQLDRYTGTVKKEFLRKNWILQKEELIQLPVLLYSLPLQYDTEFEKWSQRFNTLFRANNTAIAPLVTDSRGFGVNVIQTIGRNGQLQSLDIFDKSAVNKNFVTIAPSGSGKSYFMAYFFLNYLMTGTKIRVIDSGESYLRLCELVGGKYIRFDENSDPCFNFFTDITTNEMGEVSEESIESIIPIIGMMAKQEINKISTANTTSQDDMDRAVLSSYVADAIKSAYAMEGSEAGMREVYLALENEYKKQKRGLEVQNGGENHDVDKKLRDLIIALKPYGVEGADYFTYYNGRKNINFSENDFVVLEMKELETKGNFKNVALMTLAFSIENEFYFDDPRKKKILAIDEAWSLLDHPIVASFIEALYRKARKFAGSVGTITQALDDYYKNPSTQAMYQNAYWKFFLAPNRAELEKSRAEKKISLDDFTFEIMCSVRTEPGIYSEVMVRTGTGATSVGKLISNRTLHWAFTTNDEEKGKIKQINEQFGLDDETLAATAIGLSEDKNISIEEALRGIQNNKEDGAGAGGGDELLDLIG